ncbi:hypothetical protein [Larkinella terrae]|uniref:Uncharacterized protein n=1 Tax=Larkinella terrae TaxID=2025311 RepID=A0A7K0EIS3_9BACT|nr:hypothetical protein [Larkinella terrae]MRS61749.1 hypothetical protein [Larkinella terrae]
MNALPICALLAGLALLIAYPQAYAVVMSVSGLVMLWIVGWDNCKAMKR